ncbi:MAG: hypothetical protein LBQ81_12320 [Zoogloeaceae bacterium]|jgi:hypothetical protein|nr:hypothetical protein [Zoogloeaceae bacterium]
MPDLIDRAQTLKMAELRARHPRKPAPPPVTGLCLFCAEPLADGRRWCSVECRDDWERLDGELRRQGL